MPVYHKDLLLITPYKLKKYRNEVLRALIAHENRKDDQSLFRQNANAKIDNNTCYQDTIVIPIT